MGHNIDVVTLHDEFVFADLSSDAFSTEEEKTVLDDLSELREHLTVWDRDLTKCVSILTTDGQETIYRRRAGDLRSYCIRRGSTLWVIGVGKRRKTYDRDLDTIIDRAESI